MYACMHACMYVCMYIICMRVYINIIGKHVSKLKYSIHWEKH